VTRPAHSDTCTPPVGSGFVEVGDKVFPWPGVLPLVLIPALHGRSFPVGLCPLSPCLHNVSALPVICFPEPLFALSHMHCIAQHYTRWLVATLCSPSGLRCASDSAAMSLSQCSANTAWHGFFLRVSLQVRPRRPLGRAWHCNTRFPLF
jgi:hypothetical protein